jgi:DNA ligase D-like protein (predicted 3'-phosphoesterase)
MDGVLKSWAVPKGVPIEAKIRRLAVQTEDHPIEYADFEGVIPKGEYGAGTVKIWDKGKYEVVNTGENKLILNIEGKKVNGRYCLIRFKPMEDPKNWLLFKVKK